MANFITNLIANVPGGVGTVVLGGGVLAAGAAAVAKKLWGRRPAPQAPVPAAALVAPLVAPQAPVPAAALVAPLVWQGLAVLPRANANQAVAVVAVGAAGNALQPRAGGGVLIAGNLTLPNAITAVKKLAKDRHVFSFHWKPERLALEMLKAVVDEGKDASDIDTAQLPLQQARHNIRMHKLACMKVARPFRGKDPEFDRLFAILEKDIGDFQEEIDLRDQAENFTRLIPELGQRTAQGSRLYHINLNGGLALQGAAAIGYEGVNIMDSAQVDTALHKLAEFRRKIQSKNPDDLTILLGQYDVQEVNDEMQSIQTQLEARKELLAKVKIVDQTLDVAILIPELGAMESCAVAGAPVFVNNSRYAGVEQMTYSEVKEAQAKVASLKKAAQKERFDLFGVTVAENSLRAREQALEDKAYGLEREVDAFRAIVNRGRTTRQGRQADYNRIVENLRLMGDLYETISDRPFGEVEELKRDLGVIYQTGVCQERRSGGRSGARRLLSKRWSATGFAKYGAVGTFAGSVLGVAVSGVALPAIAVAAAGGAIGMGVKAVCTRLF